MATANQQGAHIPIIIRSRITGINAEKFADIPVSGLSIDVKFDSVDASNQFLEVRFTYTAHYKENVGRIEMKGVVMLEMDAKEAAAIALLWNTQHRFMDDFASSILNNIHYKCGTEAILPAKVIELPAPILPPRVGVTSPGGAHPQPATSQQPSAAPAQPAAPRPASPARPTIVTSTPTPPPPAAPHLGPTAPDPTKAPPRRPTINPSSIKRY